MNTPNDLSLKQKQYIPVFPKASGQTTTYIEGYPYEDDELMGETGIHVAQIATLSDQLKSHFSIDEYISIGVDSFIYYSEGDVTKCVSPDIYVVFGVAKYPLRYSFYTWAEGAVPVAVFEFISDSTAHQDWDEKARLYLSDIGVQEYFIHQPDMERPAEFRGWERSPSGDIVEIMPDERDGLFSKALNLWLRWTENQKTEVRLLRPYLPDAIPIPTSMEVRQLHAQEKELRIEAQNRRIEAQNRRKAAEEKAVEAQNRRIEAQNRRKAAEEKVAELEAEVERLRAQIANTQNEST